MNQPPTFRRHLQARAITGALTCVVLSLATVSAGWSAGTRSPGSLPQTTAEPNFTSGLATPMATLWRAMVADSPALAQRVFFPRGAYLQMKTGEIPEPSSDYAERLIAFFDLDVTAYHHVLAKGAAPAFLRLGVNPRDAQWIPAGVCENKIGYWHLPGVRLVFRAGTALESFAIASLISWRGVWYVVHLGPNPRPSAAGTVDDLTNGPGEPGPAGGC